MRHDNESLKHAVALTIVGTVALILGLSAVAYVGERIVHNFTQTQQGRATMNTHTPGGAGMNEAAEPTHASANASLIAAAPDLLAALKRLLGAYESDFQLMPNASIKVSWETNSQAIREAREAIAKSEGRP